MTNKTIIAAEQVLERAWQEKDELLATRRHIHAHPELSFNETQTASFLAAKLEKLGYRVKRNVGGTGLVAEIGDQGKLIGVRADMDALPITENNKNEYCSKNEGIMHACGHDAHSAAALGAASLIASFRKSSRLQGRFRFLFQPAEETVNEEGLSGASLMIKDGSLDEMQALIGIHVHPGMPTGILGFREGTFLAACDSFKITVIGKGGHGAHPEDTVDAVVLASNLVQTLQTLISRRKSALSPAVLTIGGIRSNTFRPNIVAEEVELLGTVRYFDETLSSFFESEILQAGKMLEPFGARMHLKYTRENPALVNDSRLTENLKNAAIELLGSDNVIDLPLELGAEDFSFYTNKIPSVFAIVGCAIPGSPREIHTSSFDIDENSLVYATALLCLGAIRLSS